MSEIHVKAIYENGVLKPEHPLDFNDSTVVYITIRRTFSDFLEKIGEPVAKEDIDTVLNETRYRTWYDDNK
ncbi:antitoxin family protein [Methanospirillum hungatei]|uniref:antitoxin family protein n=1 Tax=Methanospirillum hungatei TaxID=2203 RepID=UPI0026EAFCD8|nr:antitoxin family protein [Methanospirillum hungatei]MCA1915024.1 antitoxin family protein [Methanospirillum hungatei]